MKSVMRILGDLVETQKGFAFKSAWFCDTGRPIVKVKDFTANSIDITDLAHIDVELGDKHLRYELKTGDVIIQTVGSWPTNPASVVGKCVRVPLTANQALLNQNAVKLKPYKELDNTFLYYALKSPEFGEYIVGTAQGAASQAAITLESIRRYKVPLPDFPTQRKIAGILSAYDDLIENNLRRIKILEEMAQSLYREWFVHFRFPGHESVKMVDSSLGLIPEGWKVKKLGDIYNTSSGGTPSRKKPEYYENGDIDWVKTKELKNSFILKSEEKINTLGLAKSSAKIFPANTVLIALYGATIGQLGILSEPASTNQACCAFLIKDQNYGRAFAFYTLLCSRIDLINLRQGAAQQNISQTLLKKFKIITPSIELLQSFDALTEPILENISNLQKKNQNLRKTRDLLLPKLISP